MPSLYSLHLLSNVVLILGLAGQQCPRKSISFDCYGAGPYSDTSKVCDLSYQLCQYEWNQMPKCVDRPLEPVICNSTEEVLCTCQYGDNGYPFCECAEKVLLKKLSLYSWLGIIGCALLIIICGSIFTYRFVKRRKKRLNRPSAPPDDNVENDAPPPYETAIMLN